MSSQIERFDATPGTPSRAPQRGHPAHHRPGGGFENPWPNAKQQGFLRLLQWIIIKRGLTRLLRAPDRALFSIVAPSFASPRAAERDLTITWVGHSTFLLQVGGANVLTDPMWSERASPWAFWGPRRWVAPGVALDALPPVDVVLLSHNHYDHLDDASVRAIAAAHPSAEWVVPLGLHRFLERRGARRLIELDWWEERAVGPLQIAATPAQHFSARGVGDRNRTLWCGYAIRGGGHRVFFAGDTGHHPEFAAIGERLGPFDVALLPIGAYEPRWFMRAVHMNPEDAVDAYRELRARWPAHPTAFVPMHWGTFRLTDEGMSEPPERLRSAWSAAALGDGLHILGHGETLRK